MTEPTQTSQQDQAARSLLAVYLINGDDELKRETVLKRLTERLASMGDLMMNQQTLAIEDLPDSDYLLDALNTPPFGGQKRLVLLKNVEKIKPNLSDALLGYLQNPCETTVLVLLANKLAVSTKLYKAITAYDRQAVISVESVKRSALPDMVRQLAARFRLTVDYEAALALIERVGTSTQALDNEIKRLAAWAEANGSNQLTVGDIIEQVPALVEPKPWELADALCQRDAELTMDILGKMTTSTPTAVLTTCIARLREVLTIIVLQKRGITAARQIAEYFRKQDWQIKTSLTAAQRYSESELVAILKSAQQVEAKMKSGADADDEVTLWLLSVVSHA